MTRVLPRFPTAVRGINALSATTQNGVLEIGIDPTNLAQSADPTAPGNYTFIVNSTTGEFELAEVASTIVDIATKEEAEAGTDNTAINTPLRTTQQVDARLATGGEAETGGNATKLMTPLTAAGAVQANVFPTRAELLTRNLPAVQTRVRTSGYSAPGAGAAEYVLVGSEPLHAGKIQTPDGRWWELVDPTITPEMFGAVPNDPAVDSGPAIQAAYDAAFSSGRFKSVKHEGAYFSSIALSPTALQGASPGNFDMPFDLEFVQTSITFTGAGHSTEAAFFVKNNSDQRSVRGGVIRGSLVALNDGDWRDGIEMQACNDWSVGKLQAGSYDPSTNAAKGAFTRNGIRYTSNNGKGGLWNDWGQADAYGGELPVYIGPVANANSWNHIFAAYGAVGQMENLGDRNTIQHLSCEVLSGASLRYILKNSGAQTVIENFEFEKQDADPLPVAFEGSLWAAAGTLVAKGSFYALASGAFWKVETGAILDLTYINETSSTRRIENYCEPPTRYPEISLRRGPRKTANVVTVGVNNVFSSFQTIGDGAGVRSLVLLGVVAVNNTDQNLSINLRTVDINGGNTAGFSTVINTGVTAYIDGAQLSAECTDDTIINLFQARARTTAVSITGTLDVTAIYLEL